MTPFTLPLLNPGPLYNAGDYWIATLAYTIKIYFDFTGYSDIAIGVSALLGIDILENFDRPYWSSNISEFWRRWHMSLSSWIRDYAFIPLGGSRHGTARTLINLAGVMALAGLWHGASWHFVIWGLWHGVGLAIHRTWNVLALMRIATLPATAITFTFTFVAVGWILFASPTLGAALSAMRGLIP